MKKSKARGRGRRENEFPRKKDPPKGAQAWRPEGTERRGVVIEEVIRLRSRDKVGKTSRRSNSCDCMHLFDKSTKIVAGYDNGKIHYFPHVAPSPRYVWKAHKVLAPSSAEDKQVATSACRISFLRPGTTNNVPKEQLGVAAIRAIPPFVLSAGYDYTIRVFRLPDGACVQMIVCHGYVNKLVRKKKRCYFAVAGSRFTIVVFDFNREEGELTLVHELVGGSYASSLIVDDEGNVYSGSEDTSIRIWNNRGELLHTLNGHSYGVWCLALISPMEQLISGDSRGSLLMWDVQAGTQHKIFETENAINSIVLRNGLVYINKTAGDPTSSGELPILRLQPRSVIQTLQFTSDVSYVAEGKDKSVRRRRLMQREGSGKEADNREAEQDKWVMVADNEGKLWLYGEDLTKPAHVFLTPKLVDGRPAVIDVAGETKEEKVYAGCTDGSLWVWDMRPSLVRLCIETICLHPTVCPKAKLKACLPNELLSAVLHRKKTHPRKKEFVMQEILFKVLNEETLREGVEVACGNRYAKKHLGKLIFWVTDMMKEDVLITKMRKTRVIMWKELKAVAKRHVSSWYEKKCTELLEQTAREEEEINANSEVASDVSTAGKKKGNIFDLLAETED